jgi:hypothetical protein
VWGGLAAGGREGLSRTRTVALRSTSAQYDMAATPGVLAWLAAAAVEGAGVPGPAGSTSGSALQVLHTLCGGQPGLPPPRGCVPCTDPGCVDATCPLRFRAPSVAVALERAAVALRTVAEYAGARGADGDDAASPAANAAAALEALLAGRLRGGVASGLGGGASFEAAVAAPPARQKAIPSCAACGKGQAQDGSKFKKCGACGIPR